MHLQVVDSKKYAEEFAANFKLESHDNVAPVQEVLLGEEKAYVFFPRNHGDMHQYVRSKRKLKEEEASELFYQMVLAVAHCHENGIVLRDLKLRKFVFKNPQRYVLCTCTNFTSGAGMGEGSKLTPSEQFHLYCNRKMLQSNS